MDNSYQMGDIDRLEQMNAQQLRTFLGTMHNDITSIESLYILLKSNYFEESAIKSIRNDFELGPKKAATEKAIEQLNVDQPDLLAKQQKTNDDYEKIQKIASPHKDEGFNWLNFFACICSGAIAYYSFRYAWFAFGFFPKIIAFCLGCFLLYLYVAKIKQLCGYNFSRELSNARREADYASDQYEKAKEDYVDRAVKAAWEKFIHEPAIQKRLNDANRQTQQANQMFGDSCDRFKRYLLVLPPKYRFNNIVEAFYLMAKNGEATSWEHCTNLYISQQQNKANQEKLDQISNQQQQQNELIKGQTEALEGVNQRIDKLNDNVTQLNESVDQMHTDMNNGFNEVSANQRRAIFQNAMIGWSAINKMESIRSEIASRPNNIYYHVSTY